MSSTVPKCDQQTFEDWFLQVVIPYFRNKQGKKVIIGDNLASHLSPLVIKLCMDNNIQFAFLPRNSTHMCQPLDVAYFKPLKQSWRVVLTQWKLAHPGLGVMPKSDFAKSLNTAVTRLNQENLRAGFKKCGIYPFNRDQLLNQLPAAATTDDPDPKESVAASLIEFLNEKSFRTEEIGEGSGTAGARGRGRGRRFDVAPGKSVTEDDIPPEAPKAPAKRGRKRGAGGWSSTVASEGLKLKLKKK